MKERPGWVEYFFGICDKTKERSTCLRRQNGAVFVKNNRIITTGYNGPPFHSSHCKECFRQTKQIPSGQRHEMCFAVHSEQNCLANCSYFGISTKNVDCYTNYMPCAICFKLLFQAGIRDIYFQFYYSDQLILKLLNETKKTINLEMYVLPNGEKENYYVITNKETNIFSLGD